MELAALVFVSACAIFAIWRAALAFQNHRLIVQELRLLEYELDDV